jgi:hypothetical protein
MGQNGFKRRDNVMKNKAKEPEEPQGYNPEEDYSTAWERNRRPCDKCTEYRPNSLGAMFCWNYRAVQAAGGVNLDLRGHDVMKKKGGRWIGKRKPFWPFDYDPGLILNGCPAMIPREPYCAYCAKLFGMDNPHPEQDCLICHKPGNVCESCGAVDDEVAVIGSYMEANYHLCPACYKGLREIQDEQREVFRQQDQEEERQAYYTLETGGGQEIWLKGEPSAWQSMMWPWIVPFYQPWGEYEVLLVPGFGLSLLSFWQKKEEPAKVVPHPCQGCEFKKGMMNKTKGKMIGYPPGGKCTRAEGFCERRIEA